MHSRPLVKSEQTVDCKQSLGFFGIVEWSMQFAIHNGLAPLFLTALLLTTHEIESLITCSTSLYQRKIMTAHSLNKLEY